MITRNTFIIPLSYFCHSIVTRLFNDTDKKKPDASITELVTELVQCMNLRPTLTAKNYTAKGMSFGSEVIWILHCSRCKADISAGTLGFVLGTACYGILYHHGLEPENYNDDQCVDGSENSPQMSSHPKYYNAAKQLILKAIADPRHPMDRMTKRYSCGICFLDNEDCGTSDYPIMTNHNAFLKKAHQRYMEMRNFSDSLK